MKDRQRKGESNREGEGNRKDRNDRQKEKKMERKGERQNSLHLMNCLSKPRAVCLFFSSVE